MSKPNATRRRVLRQLGTLGTMVGTALSGCIDDSSEESTPESTTERAASPESATPTEPSPTETNIDPLPDLGDRRYTDFAPNLTDFHAGKHRIVSSQPALASANRTAFGDAESTFANRWVRDVSGVPISDNYLNVWIGGTIGVVADIDKDEFIERLQAFPINRVGTHEDFELFEGTPNGISYQVLGVSSDMLFIVPTAETAYGLEIVEHLIDLQVGDQPSYYGADPSFEPLVDALPQGVFTRMLPKAAIEDPWDFKEHVDAIGETLLFDKERSPATGRTVYKFTEDVSNPLEQVKDYVEKNDYLELFPVTIPEISMPDPRTVVVEDRVDPERVFSAR